MKTDNLTSFVFSVICFCASASLLLVHSGTACANDDLPYVELDEVFAIRHYINFNVFGDPSDDEEFVEYIPLPTNLPASYTDDAFFAGQSTTEVSLTLKLLPTEPLHPFRLTHGDLIELESDVVNIGSEDVLGNFVLHANTDENGDQGFPSALAAWPPGALTGSEGLDIDFTFDFVAHTKWINGERVFYIATRLDTLVRPEVETGSYKIYVVAKYKCNNLVHCPPFPICGDEEITYNSEFTPPSELAGKFRSTDFSSSSMVPGCSSCSGDAFGGNNSLPSLDITRLFMPANLDTRGNLSPGMFFSFDHRLQFYPDAIGTDDCIMYFDPGTGRLMHFDNISTPSSTEFHNKLMVGTTTVTNRGVFDRIVADSNTNPTTVTAYRINGWEYEFEMIDVNGVLEGRIIRISNPNSTLLDQSMTFNYLHAANDTPADLNELFKLEYIEDSYGLVADFTYHINAIDGRYVVDTIDIKNGVGGAVETSISYTYGTNDHLASVSRDGVELASYSYGQAGSEDTITMMDSSGQVPRVSTLYLSGNYQANGAGIAGTFTNVLRSISDGNGDNYLSISQSNPTSGRYDIAYHGRQMEWSPGQYIRYLDDNGQYETDFAKNVYLSNGNSNSDAEKIVLGRPDETRTETGMQINYEYDSRGNITKKTYAIDNSDEAWVYDPVFNQQTYYRDREGFVTLTQIDAKGRVVKVTNGLVATGPIPNAADDQNDNTVPTEMQYGYHDTADSKDGLLHWSGLAEASPSIIGATIDHLDSSTTIYNYDSNGRLEFVQKPQPPGQVSRPEVQNFYDILGRIERVENELDQETRYEFDAIGRLVKTVYEDGTTETMRFDGFDQGDSDPTNDTFFVQTKNRKDVIARSEYDAAGRLTHETPANATTSDPTWHTQAFPPFETPETTSPSFQQTTTTVYAAGDTRPVMVNRNGAKIFYFYDYRGRIVQTMSMVGHNMAHFEITNYEKNRVASTEKRVGNPIGDMNFDGVVNILDNDIFVAVLTGSYSGELPQELMDVLGDMDGNGDVDLADVSLFVDAISNSVGDNTFIVNKTYNAYSANEYHVRVIQTSNPNFDFQPSGDLNDHLLVLLRDTNENPEYVIQDAVRDRRGNIVRTVNGLGAITQSEIDGLGRVVVSSTIDGVLEPDTTLPQPGVSILTTTTTYNAFGNVSSIVYPSVSPDINETVYMYSPPATGIVASMTVANGAGTQFQAKTEYFYDATGRTVEIVNPSPGGLPDVNRASKIDFEESCCGQFTANIDALGHARVSRSNSVGESVHNAVIRDYSEFQDKLSQSSGTQTIQRLRSEHVLLENTSRYRPDGQKSFSTLWKKALQNADGNDLPIAGTQGVPINEGVTTRYLYDFDLTDVEGPTSNDAGLSSSLGEEFVRLDGTTTGAVSIRSALDKLAETIATGGGNLVFSSSASGSAVAIVSPDEKTVQFTISDAKGRTVMTGLIAGPASSDPGVLTASDGTVAPNDLLDWTCTIYDSVDTASENQVITTVVRPDKDSSGNLIGVASKVKSNGYGWSVEQFDEEDNKTTMGFDSGGNPLTVSMFDSNSVLKQQTKYSYDFMGRKEEITDVTLGGLKTKITYDDAGRIHEQEDAKTKKTTQLYDVLGRPTVLTDRLGHDTTNNYNVEHSTGTDFVNTVEDAENNITRYTLDVLGRRKYIDLANNQRTEFIYDGVGRIRDIKYFADKAHSNPIAKRRYIYEQPSGVLLKIQYYDNTGGIKSTDQFLYNSVLQRISGDQTTGTTTHTLDWEYTLRGQLFKETATYSGQSYETINHYDDRGRRTQITYPSNRKVDYTYTLRSEVDAISWDGSEIENRDYTALGQVSSIVRRGYTNPEVRTITGTRLDEIDTQDIGMGKMSYQYDANINKTSETFDDTVLSPFSFNTDNSGADGYDEEDRFIKFNRPGQGETSVNFVRHPAGQPSASSIGNILSISGGQYAGTREFNNIHQLNGPGTTTASQSFDGAGNLISSEQGTQFNWIVGAGRLESAVVNGDPNGIDGTHVYGYDATGRRAWKGVDHDNDPLTPPQVTVYVYSGPNCIAEFEEGTQQENNEYVYSAGIDSLAMVAYDDNSKQLGVVRNQQWSVVGLVDYTNSSSPFIAELYAYNVFGERTILDPSNGNVRLSSSFDNPYGYTSRRHDFENALMYFRARYYDPTTGEFISKDPLGTLTGRELYHDGHSLYRGYMSLYKVDPLGTTTIVPDGPFMQDDLFDDVDTIDLLEATITISFIVFDVVTIPSGEGAAGPVCAAMVGTVVRKTFKGKSKDILACEFIHKSYKNAQFKASGCTNAKTCEEAVRKAAWKATEVGLRKQYLGKRCDYILPGSIAFGSAKKASTHKKELAASVNRLAKCSAHAAKVCGKCCEDKSP